MFVDELLRHTFLTGDRTVKLSFDRPATRKLELWATALGISLELPTLQEELAAMLIELVDERLDKFRQPPKPAEAKQP